MRVFSIKCDQCPNTYPVQDEYDTQNLPRSWCTLTPGQLSGFVEALHFCSEECLIEHLAGKDEGISVSSEDLDRVEECLEKLRTGIIMGLHPQEVLTGPDGIRSQMMVVETIKDDLKELLLSFIALRSKSCNNEQKETSDLTSHSSGTLKEV